MAVQNLRIAILVVAMVAGVALQKTNHTGQHTNCLWCHYNQTVQKG
ncbi:MAG: hypothetical protein AAFY65_01980 [Pseudomonadota bacterium]